jgi:FAD-linked oxidoreductase
MRGLVAINPERQRARMRAGTTVRELGPLLAEQGMALSNQGDVDPQTLAGATGTSTHGTGLRLGSFSSMVTAAQLLTAQGELIEINANDHPDWLPAVSCHLGVLGIVTELEFQLRPSYRLEEVIEVAALKDVVANLPSLLRDNRHFEFFVFPYSDRVLVKRLNETTAPVTPKPRLELPEDDIFALLTELGHGVSPLDGPLQQLLTAVLPDSRRVGPSHQIFPSARSTRFNEMEYELPLEQGAEVLLQVIDAIRRRDINVMFPLEVRSVAADAGWISPFYRRTALAISVHQWAQADHRPLFAAVEPLLQQHRGRPHWGKMHSLTARDFAERYPRFEDFARLRAELDPAGKLLTPPLKDMLVLG